MKCPLKFVYLPVTVSLYGDGYVSMPLQEAKMSTNIRVKFRTRQADALLFLAAGRTDYCLLRLESGQISFSYKIERDVVQVSVEPVAYFS